MAYDKQAWVNEILEGSVPVYTLKRYADNSIIDDDVLIETKNVTTEGSLLSAERMNHIEDGIAEAHVPLANNAGAHNSVYRGISLGTSVSSAQFAAISAGTFDDMYIGDYWTIGGINWRIAGFNYYLNCGDQGAAEYNLTTPHLVIVPDTSLYDSAMNSTNTTEGGYYNSVMKQSNLATAISTINSAFGSGHVMEHRNLFVNAVADGRPSNGSWYDMTVDLMNEVNVFGAHHFSPVGDGTNIPYNYAVDKSIFPLFIARPDLQCNRQTFWLRDVVSSADFANAYLIGNCNYSNASTSLGVRPAFCLKS